MAYLRFDLDTIEELWTFRTGKTRRDYVTKRLGARIRAIAARLEHQIDDTLKRLLTSSHDELLELYRLMTFGGTP